jgi:hypothetical protein
VSATGLRDPEGRRNDGRPPGPHREQRRTRLDVTRLVRGRLWSAPYADPWRSLVTHLRTYDRAVLLVRVFYAAGLYFAVQSMSDWPAISNARVLEAPWPSAWIPDDSAPTVVPWILAGYLVSAIVVAAVPQLRLARGVYFLMFLQYVSLISGFGGISHNHHTWLWVSAILVLLPNGGWRGKSSTEHRHYFLSTVWICQIVVMAFYSLTGFWKIVFGIHGLLTDRMSSFEMDGFGTMIMQQQVRFNQDPVLSDFMVRNPVLAWALFVGTIYVEAAALVVAFRPRLHRAWGILLVGLHVGTELAMGFTFLPNILLVGLLFVCSPFAPSDVSLREALRDLPGVFFVSRRVRPSAGSARPVVG